MSMVNRAVPDTYLALIMKFPLVHIRNRAHLREAQAVIDRLLQEDLDEGGRDYLDALSDLVEVYEHEHVHFPDASEADVLRALMEANGLSQSALAREVGMYQSAISNVLKGTRSLTKQQVVALAKRFNVDPAAFLPA